MGQVVAAHCLWCCSTHSLRLSSQRATLTPAGSAGSIQGADDADICSSCSSGSASSAFCRSTHGSANGIAESPCTALKQNPPFLKAFRLRLLHQEVLKYCLGLQQSLITWTFGLSWPRLLQTVITLNSPPLHLIIYTCFWQKYLPNITGNKIHKFQELCTCLMGNFCAPLS